MLIDAVSASGKLTDCYLGLLYALEDVAVYGYITPLKLKIILALGLTDTVIKDAEVNMVCMPCLLFISSPISIAADFQSTTHGLLFRHRKSFPQARHAS